MYFLRYILFSLFILIQSAGSLADTITPEDPAITSEGPLHMVPYHSIIIYLLEFKEDGRVFYKGRKIGTDKELFQTLDNVLSGYKCPKFNK